MSTEPSTMSETQNTTLRNYKEFCIQSRKSSTTPKQLLEKLEANLRQYEQTYQMTSEEFIARYESGEFEMDDAFPGHELFSWWSDYQSCCRLRNGNG